MTSFQDLGLSADLNNALTRMNYTNPTPIQAKAIPMALDGRDILGSAQTGTGKTAAFCIPLVEKLLNQPLGTALILTPTRELAKQVLDVVHQLLGHKSQIKTAFIIGGEPIGKQFQQLKMAPRIIVGTPGRVNDHLDRGSMNLSQTEFLVLDETDRMLDMGFGIQLDQIAKHLPQERQTLMFSATLPNSIIKLSNKYLSNPQRIAVGETNVVAKNIKQDVMHIEQDKKYDELIKQLHDREGSVIVFAKTKHGSDRIAKNLRRDGFEADALHGDLRQNKRTQVMKKFQDQKIRVLVATDIAARGLDVPHIRHVINYDLPQVAEDYIHRMGRTARAGAEGAALCFVASHDSRKWHAIKKLLGIQEEKAANDRERPFKSRSNKGPKKDKSRWDKKKKQSMAEKEQWKKPPRSQKQQKKREEAEPNFNKDGAHKQTRFEQQNRKPQGQKPRRRHFDEQRGQAGQSDRGQTRFKRAGTGKKPYTNEGKPQRRKA